MVSIQIFDPAMCCATGVCGVDVDQALVSFAADVDRLKSQAPSGCCGSCSPPRPKSAEPSHSS